MTLTVNIGRRPTTRQDRLFMMVYTALELYLSLYPKERVKLRKLIRRKTP